MPIVELIDGEYQIPFDAEVIANHLYQGNSVYPDDNTDEKQLFLEQKMVNGHLFKREGELNLNNQRFIMPLFQGTGKQYARRRPCQLLRGR